MFVKCDASLSLLWLFIFRNFYIGKTGCYIGSRGYGLDSVW